MTKPIPLSLRRLGSLILASASSLLLVACASAPTAYQPVDKNDIGYEEVRIETNRYRVQFNGGNDVGKLDVEQFALKRAAELTVDAGGEWFRVASREIWRDGDRSSSSRTGVGVGASGGSGGVGVGVGVSFDLTPDRSRYIAVLEILIGQGDKPADDANIYDAQSILDAQNTAS